MKEECKNLLYQYVVSLPTSNNALFVKINCNPIGQIDLMSGFSLRQLKQRMLMKIGSESAIMSALKHLKKTKNIYDFKYPYSYSIIWSGGYQKPNPRNQLWLQNPYFDPWNDVSDDSSSFSEYNWYWSQVHDDSSNEVHHKMLAVVVLPRSNVRFHSVQVLKSMNRRNKKIFHRQIF